MDQTTLTAKIRACERLIMATKEAHEAAQDMRTILVAMRDDETQPEAPASFGTLLEGIFRPGNTK